MDVKELIIRLLLSILVGAIIGYDREYNNRPAGLRTHILVCLGATIVSFLEVYMVRDTINLMGQNSYLMNVLKVDITRIGAQVITGVGFLGAGSIIQEGGSVKGLTTAASLWVVACIGLTLGKGYYFFSILSALLVIAVLAFLKKVENKKVHRTYELKLKLSSEEEKKLFNLRKLISDYDIEIKSISIEYKDESIEKIYIYILEVPMSIDILEALDKEL